MKDQHFLHYKSEPTPDTPVKTDLKEAKRQTYDSLSDKRLQDLMNVAVEFEAYENAQIIKDILDSRT